MTMRSGPGCGTGAACSAAAAHAEYSLLGRPKALLALLVPAQPTHPRRQLVPSPTTPVFLSRPPAQHASASPWRSPQEMKHSFQGKIPLLRFRRPVPRGFDQVSPVLAISLGGLVPPTPPGPHQHWHPSRRSQPHVQRLLTTHHYRIAGSPIHHYVARGFGRGVIGAGKTTLANALGEVFGRPALPSSPSPTTIVGQRSRAFRLTTPVWPCLIATPCLCRALPPMPRPFPRSQHRLVPFPTSPCAHRAPCFS